MTLDLHRLRLLREFASRGSIAATAAALGYTPSAVSQQLAALEREAGAALLDRTARSAELTDSGRRLAGHAEQILARVEAAEADLSAHTRTPSGQVVVLRLFHLLRDPLVLVVPRDHRMASAAEQVDLRRLREEPWLAAPAGEPSRQAVDLLLASVGGAPPVPWEFEGLATILGLVSRSIGIAAIPALTLAAAEAGPPRSVAPDDAKTAGDTGASPVAESPVVVRELPGTLARNIYAAARAASVRRVTAACGPGTGGGCGIA